jgi:hypothetical protein
MHRHHARVSLVDDQSLSAFQTLAKDVASKLVKGEKAQGWELGDVDYSYDGGMYGEADSSVGTGTEGTEKPRWISVSVKSKSKVNGEHYASFNAYCRSDGTCSVNHIRFAQSKPKYGGVY